MGSGNNDIQMMRQVGLSAVEVSNETYKETPTRTVKITRPFFLSAHEVTVAQFRQFASQNGYITDAEKPNAITNRPFHGFNCVLSRRSACPLVNTFCSVMNTAPDRFCCFIAEFVCFEWLLRPWHDFRNKTHHSCISKSWEIHFGKHEAV